MISNTHILILALLVLLVPGAVCSAQPSERVGALVSQLDDESWLSRDQATLELGARAPDITLDDLEMYLADVTLSLEARSRLIEACRMRFVDQPKGGLGVSFGSVRVGAIEVVPMQNNLNFPASAMLNPGDAIAMVNGTVLTSSFDLRAQILSRAPGDFLPVTLIRNNRLIEMELPLGSFGKLAGAALLDPRVARRALELRWERKGIQIEPPRVIGSSIDQDRWLVAAFPQGVTPEPRSPTRRSLTALIGGAKERISTATRYMPRRFKPWQSGLLARARLVENQIMLGGVLLERLESDLALVELKIHGLDVELKAADSERNKLRLKELLDSSKAQLEALRASIIEHKSLIARLNNFDEKKPAGEIVKPLPKDIP